MKLSTKSVDNLPNYPRRGSFFPNRQFLQILASLGIVAGGAIAGPTATTASPKTDKNATIEIPLDKLGSTVEVLCSKLGDKNFKVRKASMLKLIQIGKGKFSNIKESETAKKSVLAAVAKLSKHADPEVRTRAKKVTSLLVARPKPRIRHIPKEEW